MHSPVLPFPPSLMPTICVVAVLMTVSPSLGSTYYVDPANGNDRDSGTSPTTAWRTLPGTAADGFTRWVSSSYGGTPPCQNPCTKLIHPGDTIYFKAGTTYTPPAAIDICNAVNTDSRCVGPSWLNASSYYDDGTPLNPIRIQVHPSWGSGHVTISLAGITSTNDLPATGTAGFRIRADYVWLQGAGPTRRFKFANSGLGGDSMSWMLRFRGRADTSNYATGGLFRYIGIDGSNNALSGSGTTQKAAGLDVSAAEKVTIADFTAHGMGCYGLCTGDGTTPCLTTSYDCAGSGSCAARCDRTQAITIGGYNDNHVDSVLVIDADVSDGSAGVSVFGNTSNIKLVRVDSHNNIYPVDRRGIGGGGINGRNRALFSVFDSKSYDNLSAAFNSGGCDKQAECQCSEQHRIVIVDSVGWMRQPGQFTDPFTGETFQQYPTSTTRVYGGGNLRLFNTTLLHGQWGGVLMGSDGRLGSCVDTTLGGGEYGCDEELSTPGCCSYAGNCWTDADCTNACAGVGVAYKNGRSGPIVSMPCCTGLGTSKCRCDRTDGPGVLKHCAGGKNFGSACTVDGDCPASTCGAEWIGHVSRLTARNSIFQPTDYGQTRGVNCYGSNDTVLSDSPTNGVWIDSDRNIWSPAQGGANTDDWAKQTNSGGCTSTYFDYTFSPDWKGPNDLVGTANSPLFVSTSDTRFAANDFNLRSGSPGIDAGGWYCKVTSATGSGTSFDVDCDPNEFFYDASDYPGDFIADDVAYVGTDTGTACTVASLSTTSAGRDGAAGTGTITCTNSVSWIRGQGVSRRVIYGTAPDIGAFEFTGSGLSAPVLQSVQPLP